MKYNVILLIVTITAMLIAFALCEWLRKRPMRRARRGKTACFANIGEGTSGTGNKSYLPDAAISNRFNLVIIGSTQYNVAASSANTDIPLGVCTDAPDSTLLDIPVNVSVLGCANGTLRVVLGGTVAVGDMLQSNGDGTAIKLLTTTGTFYNIGRALMAGVSGDTIEFAHSFPVKVVNP